MPIAVLRSCALTPLRPDFLSVLESEPYIVLAVDGHEVHQSAPKGCVEGVHQIGIFEGGKEIFNRSPAGLLAADGFVQGFVPCLCGVESLRQPVIAFFVFHLVECHMSVFVDALFDKVGNHSDFAFQFSLFRFEGGKVKCCIEGCGECRNDGIFLRYQLVCSSLISSSVRCAVVHFSSPSYL